MHLRTTKRLRVALCAVSVAAISVVGVSAASASGGSGGSGGGGAGGGGTTPSCLTMTPGSVQSEPLLTVRRGVVRIIGWEVVVFTSLTNCGTTSAQYTMRLTDISTHANPICTVGATQYGVSLVAGGSQEWGQRTVTKTTNRYCPGEHYDMVLEATQGTAVVPSNTYSLN